ncbi:MAG: low molecular weight protein-tyrosine-phosphatase [Streptosporangiaceae bacterium]
MTAESVDYASVPEPRDPQQPYRICMVCLGNICRSPMAEVILRDELAKAGLAGKVTVSSAGTGDWHVGRPMDARARAELTRRGHDGSGHQARQIQQSWLYDYDLFLAMDRRNLANLQRMAAGNPELTGRIQLLRSFDPDSAAGAEVPDPYDGRPGEFIEVFELVQAAATRLATRLAAVL